MSDEEKDQYKAKFAVALRKAKEVENQRRTAQDEVDNIIRGQDLRAQ